MNKSNQSLIKEANSLFKQQKYEEAEDLYKRAGDKLGFELVETSIWLCQTRKKRPKKLTPPPTKPVFVSHDEFTAENFSRQKKQLAQTQQLLEEYYTQTQNLKLQLMQRN